MVKIIFINLYISNNLIRIYDFPLFFFSYSQSAFDLHTGLYGQTHLKGKLRQTRFHFCLWIYLKNIRISLTLFILAVLYSTLSSGKATEKVGKCYAEFYGIILLQN